MQYTVRQATATGKSDPTYGEEYIVHFNEDQRDVKMSRKQAPEPGHIENGTIMENKYGAYFKKDPFVPGQSPAPAAQAPKSSNPFTPRRDNSDGQRQGMCINNASAYVATLKTKDTLTSAQWAQLVYKYATALYAMGDLKVEEDLPEITAEEAGGDIAALLGAA